MPPPRQPVNLSFEHHFDGWIIAGSSPQDYIRSIEVIERGTHTAYFKNAVEQPRGNIMLQQIINAYDYRGKTVHLSTTLRAESVTQQASLYLGQGVGNKSQIERTIQGTTDWQAYDVILFIPDEPGRIEFGRTLYGSGQVWMRDTQLSLL